jgi:hypothetical protein
MSGAEFRIVERRRLRPEEEVRVYQQPDDGWSEWAPVRTRSSEGGRYDTKASAERAILQLKNRSYRFEEEFKIQSRPLTNDWTDA